MNLAKFLQELVIKGWKFWHEENQLYYDAPSEQLTSELLAQLKQHKVEIIKLLQKEPDIFNVHPLSYGQKALWFVWKLEPESAAYNVAFSVRIFDDLNVDLLRAAFVELVDRHPCLRSTFPKIGEQPIQQVHQNFQLDWQQIDAASWDEAELHSQVVGESKRPFDLENKPIIRIKLFKVSSSEYILLITIHHIAIDGWSFDIILSELSKLYQAKINGICPSLTTLKNSYSDYVRSQEELLEGTEGQKLLGYWESKLRGELPALNLPIDKPRPAIQTYNGASIHFELSEKLTQRLKQLARDSNATLYMTLLAAFQVLLYRYTGTDDILVGSPVAGRLQSQFRDVVGYFVNLIVLRGDLSKNPSFIEFLTQIRQTVNEALIHQNYPFALLVEKLQPERDFSRSPIFQTSFNLQQLRQSQNIQNLFVNETEENIDWGGLKLGAFEIPQEEGQNDLDLEVLEGNLSIKGIFKYNTDLFNSQTIERMIVHFQNLLEAIVENPDQNVGHLPLLLESERHQLLVEWNNTATDYPQDECIHHLFEEQVEKTPNAIALTLENQQLTYRELNRWANQLAHYLQSLAMGSGVLVGIGIEPSLEQVVSILAVLKANCVYVPLDPNYPQERLAFMVEDTKVSIILTKQSLNENIFPQHAHIVCLDKERDAIAKESVANLNCPATLDDLAYAIYTSGSTGRPKAVLGKMRGIVNRLHWIWDTLPFAADEICAQKTSINFVDHVAEIFSPLLKGIPLVIVPNNIRTEVDRLMSLLGDRKITRIVLVPSLLKAMLNSSPQQLKQLRELKYVFCSGEALPLSLAEAFEQKLSYARLFNVYGSSEVAADVTYFEVNFWETRQRILEYFKPEVVSDTSEDRVLGVQQKLFTKPGVSSEMLAKKFQRSELPSYPVTVDDYYDKFNQEVLPYTIDTGSPTFIGHMTSALPDFMHDMSKMISRLNQNLVKIETSKSLIFLEREAIAILHRLLYGYDDKFYESNIQQKNRNLGIITTGGTTANISALLCARNSGLLSQENSWELSKESLHKILDKKGYDDIVILGSRLMHYSINKAASMLGLGTNNVVFIDNDCNGKLNLNLLRAKIRECRKNNLYILGLVAIAGTTETGEIDPLSEMGDIAQEFGIHFHVDAAWGGATIFSDKHKGKLRGIDKADSITLCGHKQLYLPQGISVCLLKDPQMLSFTETTARYQAQRDTFDVGRFTIEGSRSAMSLCLHGALHIIGKKGYEILIDNGIEKAKYFSRLIELLEPFELIMQPSLNIVNYRYIPDGLRKKAQQKSLSKDDIQRINQLNTQIQREQFEQGMTFVSKTTLMDTNYDKDLEMVVFRAVLSNPNTTATDLQSILEDQLRIANQIEARSNEQLPVQQINSNNIKTAAAQKEAIHLRLVENSKAHLEEYLKKNTISIGKPIANTQIYILDKHGNLLPPGITGELYIGGDGLAQGYLNMPELTEERFIPNPFTKTAERLYKTGDIARWLPNGNIELVGRIDRQIKIRGFRIELGEIEATLTAHPQVNQAVVIAQEENTGSKHLVAYIVADSSVTTVQLREYLKGQLPNYMAPRAFVTLESFPLMPNGKIDRKALPIIDGQISRETEYIAPRTQSEIILANIFSDILGVQNIGIEDNFFELGGHSLLAMQLISRIRETFAVELTVRNLFEEPTIANLSKIILNTDSALLQKLQVTSVGDLENHKEIVL